MSKELFNITCNTFSDNLRHMMKDLSNSKDFADVTLVCDDQKQIQAHRNILSACSPVFKNMLQIESHSKHSVIFLRGVQHSEMESIIQFIYLGQATFYEDRMNEFLSIAKSLQIPELDKTFDSYSQPPAEQVLLAPALNSGKMEEMADSKIFDLDDSLPMPIIKTHGDIVYNCYECGLTFERKNSLTVHRSEFHGMKSFPCNQCDQQFTRTTTLKTHIQNIHEGIKFPCNQCNQQYTQENNLKAHIRYAHEGQNACSVCGRKFARKDALRHHVESIHNVKFL